MGYGILESVPPIRTIVRARNDFLTVSIPEEQLSSTLNQGFCGHTNNIWNQLFSTFKSSLELYLILEFIIRTDARINQQACFLTIPKFRFEQSRCIGGHGSNWGSFYIYWGHTGTISTGEIHDRPLKDYSATKFRSYPSTSTHSPIQWWLLMTRIRMSYYMITIMYEF